MKKETSNSRQAVCTHASMTRVFHGPTPQICDLCGRSPRLGWVYICTQDHDGHLPNHESAGFFTANNPSVLKHIGSPVGPPELKAWMKKAIEEGHYTPEEIKVLKTQRLEVQEAVSASVFQPRKPAKDDPLTRLFEQLKETCPSPRPDSKNIAESTEPKKRRVGSIALPACRFRLCHACRPGWQERTWASLNRILEDEDYAKEPPEWEIRNRPISDAASVRTIGLPKPEPPPRPRNPLYPQLLLEDNDRSIESQNSISIRKASHSPPRSNVRPSVGRRIPLKRSARGSFSRGHDGALYFGNDSPLQHTHNDNIPLRTKSTEGKESDLASNDDVDSDGGVPLMKG